MSHTFCPLYHEATQSKPWKNAASAHAGLVFDKFGDAWRWKSDHSDKPLTPRQPEFDKGRNKQGAGEWLVGFTGSQNNHGDAQLLAQACKRQGKLITALGGRVLLLTNTSRFVTGMGREHPLENGFVWHHTLGTPYLPGSSLKGMLRAWDREVSGNWSEEKNGNDETSVIKDRFGVMGMIGNLILFDVIPFKTVELVAEVMTPHYGPYYQDTDGKTFPGDWHSPIPVSYLAVAENQQWQVGVAPRRSTTVSDSDLDKIVELLVSGLEFLGLGAKTAIGMGRFARNVELEFEVQTQMEQEQARQRQQQHQAAEEAAFKKSLGNDSEQLAQLKTLRRSQNWTLEAADANLTAALQKFADETPKPPQDCLNWIRDLLESIPNYKGVWDDPEATKGKVKSPKPKYSSKKIRELVKSLNPQLK